MRIKFIPAQILVGAYDIEKEMVNLIREKVTGIEGKEEPKKTNWGP